MTNQFLIHSSIHNCLLQKFWKIIVGCHIILSAPATAVVESMLNSDLDINTSQEVFVWLCHCTTFPVLLKQVKIGILGFLKKRIKGGKIWKEIFVKSLHLKMNASLCICLKLNDMKYDMNCVLLILLLMCKSSEIKGFWFSLGPQFSCYLMLILLRPCTLPWYTSSFLCT